MINLLLMTNRSFPVDKATTAGNDPEETDKSSNGTCTGTMAGTLAKIVEGVQQNLREGCCSSTSSDSLLPLSSSNLIGIILNEQYCNLVEFHEGLLMPKCI